MVLIVKSNLKRLVPGFQIATELLIPLEKAVEEKLKKAASRAEANGRTTIMARDI